MGPTLLLDRQALSITNSRLLEPIRDTRSVLLPLDQRSNEPALHLHGVLQVLDPLLQSVGLGHARLLLLVAVLPAVGRKRDVRMSYKLKKKFIKSHKTNAQKIML